jgi:predicted metalloprotease with PDZ domain
MHYKIFSKNPKSQFLTVECFIKNTYQQPFTLQLPAWRPGRYELQNFAKNISRFEIFDENGSKIPFRKIKKDAWLIDAGSAENIIVSFDYYAVKRDAGNSYLDANLLYINPVNLCPYILGEEESPRTLEVLHDFKDLVCGLPKGENGFFIANNFYELADSPLMASNHLAMKNYKVENTTFYIWFEGNFIPQWERILKDFESFTIKQIELFGEFPETEYHFITWILPEAFYHGVEHRNSTMLVLGPDSQDFESLYLDLLGVASHELFHAWNICKIRPIELSPYDYTKENYFETCYVSEGITTYYGDLILYKSGVFTKEMYQHELETCHRRHFAGAAGAWQSLAESSFDLWLDGYAAGVPKRKVSVYHKGAIAAQILDEKIQKLQPNRSLDDVMRLLWQRHGKPQIGFTAADYRAICEEVAGEDLTWYFDEVINGNAPLEGYL